MYLHLGKNTVVTQNSIVAIFDLDNTTSSNITRDYLSRAEKEGKVVNVSEELPKSFVVCRQDGEQRVYLSQMAPSTLLRRADGMGFDPGDGII